MRERDVCPHGREPVGMKAEAFRTMLPKAFVMCDDRGAGHGRRLTGGGERQDNVPRK
jgi:hypothetical protein